MRSEPAAPSPVTGPSVAVRSMTVIVVCGCLISLIGFGVRSSYGLFNDPLSDANGWGRGVFALALAIQNIVWGAAQPFAGAMADRFGPARVLTGGALLYALGVVLTPYSDAPWMLHLTAGVLVGLGLAGASFGIVLAGFARFMAPEKRSWAAGIATASGSLGQFIFAPMGVAFIAGYGWVQALVMLGAFMLAVPLLSLALTGGQRPGGGGHGAVEQTTGQALRQAFSHPSYNLLVAGFFVCGFHVAFITVHLPPYLSDLHMPPALAGWAIALIGLFNVVGSYGSGILAGKRSKRGMLCLIYAVRAVAIAAFILLPVTPASVLIFAAVMGLMWLSTVPPTSGLIALMFGVRHLGMLFGVVFFSHQVGAFLGVWLGGVMFERTGSYDAVWWASVALGLFATLVHLPIRERPAEPAAVPAE
jgi:MFS family permease